jgi:hypothetical protein
VDVARGARRVRAVDDGGRALTGRAVRDSRAGLDAPSAEPRPLPGPVTVGPDVDGSLAAFLQAVLPADGLPSSPEASSGMTSAAGSASRAGRRA